MPFFSDDQFAPGGILAEPQAPPVKPAPPTFGLALETAFSDLPIVRGVSALADSTRIGGDGKIDPGFDPFAPDNLHGYENYADSFVHVRNASDMQVTKAKIDGELKDQDILGNSGTGITASLIAGLADPVNFLPVIGQAGKLYELGRLGRAASVAGRLALTGGASASIDEGVLQAATETRTAGQSVSAIAATALFSGVLGGAFGSLAKAPAERAAKAVTAGQEGEIYGHMVGEAVGDTGGSVGAASASVIQTTAAQEKLKSALGFEKFLSFQDPLLRTATSPSVETRRISQLLAEQPLLYAKNKDGIPSPIAAETRMRNWYGGLYQANEAFEDAFVKYRLGRARKPGDVTALAAKDLTGSTQLTMDQFADEVGSAMRRGDKHAIPEVAEAATALRQQVFDPLKNEAIKLGLLPEGVDAKTAESYLTRVYDTPRIVAERPQFEAVLNDWLRSIRDDKVTLDRVLPMDDRKGGTVDKSSSDQFLQMTDGELQDVAAQITDTIVGLPRARLPYGGVPLVRGPLKDRTLLIGDAAIEPWLKNDVRMISRMYTRTMGADVELTRAFGRADLETQLDDIRQGYQRLRNGVTKPKKLQKLDKQERADLRDVAAMRDRMRGNYALPDNPEGLAYRSARALKTVNYLALMGNVTLASIPDMARTAMIYGIGNTLKDGLLPMIRNFKRYRLASDEVKLAGNALDMVMDERNMSFAELLDDYSRASKFERGLDYASHKFGLLSLMTPWNAALKQFSGVVIQTQILRAAEGSVTPALAERLAFLGIDKPMLARIGAQFKQHGKKDGGVYWANTLPWTDREAALAYRSALSKEVNITIVTPGQDKPLWMSKPMLGLIGQFKSFAISSNQRVLLSSLQQRDRHALTGALLSVGLGMLVYRIRTPDDKISDDWRQWVAEGVDRSGITGSFFDLNNMAEKLSNGNIGVSHLTGKQMSRYASRNFTGAILGPTGGAIENVGKATSGLLSGQPNSFTASDLHGLRQMLPAQNLFYTRRLFDAMEEGTRDYFGLRAKQK